jgi:ABC-type oligopeptide transport system substrate-binding subunit
MKAYYQADVCDVCAKPDIPRAKDLASKAGIPPGTKVSLAFNTGGGHEAWVQAVQQQLETNLGLKVDLQPQPFAELLKKEAAPTSSGLFRAAWTADYPSAENFLFPLLAKASLPPGDNRGRYVNQKFEDSLAAARRATEDGDRVTNIKAAEKQAIGEDMALIPLWYRSQYRVYDSAKWSGVSLDFFENPVLATISLK